MKWIIALLLTIPLVFAQPTSINVLNLEYNNEDIKILEKFSMLGYYPDRQIQPSEGYLLKIIGVNDEILYSVRFMPPTNEYLDGWDGTYNLGEIYSRTKFNFSLVVPSFSNERQIVISKDNKEFVLNLYDQINIRLLSGILLLLVICAMLIIIYSLRRKSKSSQS